MKTITCAAVFALGAFPAVYSALTLPSQESHSVKECSQHGTLELVPGKDGQAIYKIGDKTYAGYPLDDLRKLLEGSPGCERPLYVLIDYRVPIGNVPGAVTSKLQAENVRYFIQYPDNVVEIRIVGFDEKLPKGK